MVETVQRDDLLSRYLEFVNRAIHEIAIKHSFNEMKAQGSGTVTIGQTRATLPADFKELQDGRYPVFDSVANALVPVYMRPEVEKLIGTGAGLGLVPPNSFIYTQDFTGGAASFRLDLPQVATATHTLTINYFAYPVDATDPTTTTPLIQYYFNMVLLKSVSIAFLSLNDPVYKLHEMQFIQDFSIETGMDIRKAMVLFGMEKT